MKKEEAFEKAHIAEREEAAVTSSNQDLKATPQEEPEAPRADRTDDTYDEGALPVADAEEAAPKKPSAEGDDPVNGVKKAEKAFARARAKKIVARALTCVGACVLALLTVVVATLAVQKFILKKPVPSFAGYSQLIVVTGSMSGTIEEGDMVIIKRTGEYKTGDIITFLKEGETVPTTHRILRITGDLYYTKGDANLSFDTVPVAEDEILGEVVKVLPRVGIFAEWLKTPEGLMYLILAFVIVGVSIYVLRCTFVTDEEESDENPEVKAPQTGDPKNDTEETQQASDRETGEG
ncbi:MAG: signal peptidase I [Ruminococcaceae bacterium]|nr:signal peptidase I [Oscillospiraceae bacterium]